LDLQQNYLKKELRTMSKEFLMQNGTLREGQDTKTDCPVCRSGNARFLFENEDILYGYPDSFPLWRCNDCGHIFLVGNFTPEMLTNLYTHYYPRSHFDIENYKPYLEEKGFMAWLDGKSAGCHRWVPPNVRVLDIGCGFCQTLGYHKNRGCEVYGCEADENIKLIAERHGFNVHVGLFNPDNYEKDFFDYVTMDQVLEHIVDPIETLRQIHTILKPGGKLIVGVPDPACIERYTFGRHWQNWHTPYHPNMFSQKSMKTAFEQTGFVFTDHKCISLSHRLFNQWCLLLVHGGKGKKSYLTDQVYENTTHFNDETKRLWHIRLYVFLKKVRIHAWLSRFADAFGIGANRLYFATKR
jgi:SAM-dependent methyltransferase